MKDQEIEIIYTYHAPKPEDIATFAQIRARAKWYALTLNKICPQCVELDEALKHLQQVVMWANAAVALDKPRQELFNKGDI